MRSACCARRERPRHGGATNKCNEFPSPHGFARAKDYIGYEKNITFWIENCAVRYTKRTAATKPPSIFWLGGS